MKRILIELLPLFMLRLYVKKFVKHTYGATENYREVNGLKFYLEEDRYKGEE